MDNKPNLSREVKLRLAGSRERLSTPVEAEFFLDIHFIEIIEKVTGEIETVVALALVVSRKH